MIYWKCDRLSKLFFGFLFPDIPICPFSVWRKKCRYLLHNLMFRVFISFLIISDVIIGIVQLAVDVHALDIVSLVLACIFVVETAVRIYVKGYALL